VDHRHVYGACVYGVCVYGECVYGGEHPADE
jgi:hypothetical protein